MIQTKVIHNLLCKDYIKEYYIIREIIVTPNMLRTHIDIYSHLLYNKSPFDLIVKSKFTWVKDNFSSILCNHQFDINCYYCLNGIDMVSDHVFIISSPLNINEFRKNINNIVLFAYTYNIIKSEDDIFIYKKQLTEIEKKKHKNIYFVGSYRTSIAIPNINIFGPRYCINFKNKSKIKILGQKLTIVCFNDFIRNILRRNSYFGNVYTGLVTYYFNNETNITKDYCLYGIYLQPINDEEKQILNKLIKSINYDNSFDTFGLYLKKNNFSYD
jgi:hypothetical protein